MWDSSSWDDQWEDLPATERPWTRVLYYLMFTLKQREERTSMQSISFYSWGKGNLTAACGSRNLRASRWVR